MSFSILFFVLLSSLLFYFLLILLLLNHRVVFLQKDYIVKLFSVFPSIHWILISYLQTFHISDLWIIPSCLSKTAGFSKQSFSCGPHLNYCWQHNICIFLAWMSSHYWYFSTELHIFFLLNRVAMSYTKCVASVAVVYKQMSEKCHLMDKIKVVNFFSKVIIIQCLYMLLKYQFQI